MRVTWDAGVAVYSSGISQAVVYLEDGSGIPWNGIISITEAGQQAQESRYFEGRKYMNRLVTGAFAGKISAYTYPGELEAYIGIENVFRDQLRRPFSLSYRLNNEIHIVYNVLTAPSARNYETLAEDVNPVMFDWNFTTQPEKIPGGKPTSHIVILIDESNASAISDLEARLYGDDLADPSLPSPDDIVLIFESHAIVQITDNGDGTWTASGPDTAVVSIDANTFQINWTSVLIIDTATFVVSSL